jgi:formylmethanofuran dehydrogenase subunit E
LEKSVDEELVAIVENDSCSLDAVQVVTECTFGKGNLVFRDFGKHVYTFINKDTGDTVRISLRSSVDLEHVDRGWSQLRAKVSPRPASPKEELEFRKRAEKSAETLYAAKFPNTVYSFKPAPDSNIPASSSAYSHFWDLISLTPESTHMILGYDRERRRGGV